MSLKVTSLEAGTQLHLAFEAGLPDGDDLTMNVFTQDSIDVKIWQNKHTCHCQTFIDVDDLLRAADLIKEIRKDLNT